MHNKFISTITAGAIIGVVAGVMLIPNMDKNIKERVKKVAENGKNMIEDMNDNMNN
ncbi:YtxH domain-containing protein [Clostridium lacusfryxellense]|uniref:YtxH domain-containing protein n=1 Tax=Clostridium lacusfryxellense TaxID=205328 RepID=UPI001C0ACBED|nr:YtxH domain-containing protein [Clostridium lacusfryxellense]MBU3110861.1 YtxH domain-containing protein [Clostridium lacusfryxellense]